jgi:hypothetical protein
MKRKGFVKQNNIKIHDQRLKTIDIPNNVRVIDFSKSLPREKTYINDLYFRSSKTAKNVVINHAALHRYISFI